MRPDSGNAPRVVAVGGANMDISVTTPTPLMSQDSTPGQILCAAGGVARNVAENLARLGVSTRLISAVGDDVFGQRVREVTAAAGVDVSALQVVSGQRSASYLSLHGPDGDMAIAVNDMDILRQLTPALLQTLAPVMGDADAVVADCNLPPETLGWLLDHVTHAPIFVDAVSAIKCTRLVPHLPSIHTLKVNRLEAQALSGIPVHGIDGAQRAALRLRAMGVRQVVVSLGADGVCWCDATGQTGHVAARPNVLIVNTTGAGDALLAGLVHAQLAGQSLGLAVQWACACAEITMGCAQANAPTLSVPNVQSRLFTNSEAK